MGSFLMAAREINLNEEYDVIVAGGGPAGCTAAAAAAREGAKTLLIEATCSLGGMGTSGLVPAWCPFSDHEKIIYRGMAQRVFDETKAAMPHINPASLDWVPIDPEHLKYVYDSLVTEFGADILFNTQVTGLQMKKDGEVDVIITASKEGLTAYRAKVFIDCTGDADIAAWAGAEYEKGDDADGDLQPATLCFILSNVDEYAYRNLRLHGSNPNSAIHKILASKEFPLIPDAHICNSLIGPRAVGFNAGHVWEVDNTKPHTVSRAMIEGRKIARALRDALAKFEPRAFANAFLVSSGSLLGVRETRRIIGDYYLTVDDLMSFRDFDDEIGRNCYFVDVHHKKSQIGTDEEGASKCFRFPAGKSHGLPYRCLTPKGIKNVLVAGRSISTDRPSQGSTRVMPVCLMMGEAAGIAAAHAAAGNGDVHAIDVKRLQTRLKEEGGYLLPNQ